MVDKPGSNVAEDQRVVILTGLVNNNRRISAARRTELVLSNIGDPGCQAKVESLNRNSVNGIDRAIAIHISRRQPASRQGSPENEVLPLHGDRIHGVDVTAGGARRQGAFRRRHGISPASHQR